MRNSYWGIEALLGVALILTPIVGRFTALHRASYPDVSLGAVIILWALVGYDRMQPANHTVHHRSRF